MKRIILISLFLGMTTLLFSEFKEYPKGIKFFGSVMDYFGDDIRNNYDIVKVIPYQGTEWYGKAYIFNEYNKNTNENKKYVDDKFLLDIVNLDSLLVYIIFLEYNLYKNFKEGLVRDYYWLVDNLKVDFIESENKSRINYSFNIIVLTNKVKK